MPQRVKNPAFVTAVAQVAAVAWVWSLAWELSYVKEVAQKRGKKFMPMWCSGNESDEDPRERRFDPWPRSVG